MNNSSAEQELKEYVERSSQHTLKDCVSFEGVGIHSGEKCQIVIAPAPANSGIYFVRSDIKSLPKIPALWNYVSDTTLCTTISNEQGIKVSTIEHLMSALSACQIDNACITVTSEETPILDGSAIEYIDAFERVGTVKQTSFRKEIIILEEVEVRRGKRWAKLLPAEKAKFSFEIEFDSEVISNQKYEFVLEQIDYKNEIAGARTFGFYDEIEHLKKLGFAKGGSLQNAVVVDKDKILNEGGLRFPEEFVRHKLLDAAGDLYLAGCPIRGHYIGNCSGHAINNQLLHMLFKESASYCYV